MIIFLTINLNMCFGCKKEPSHLDSSFEYPQHMFWMRNKEISFPICTLIWRPAPSPKPKPKKNYPLRARIFSVVSTLPRDCRLVPSPWVAVCWGDGETVLEKWGGDPDLDEEGDADSSTLFSMSQLHWYLFCFFFFLTVLLNFLVCIIC